uniref:HEAT repeat protein n=1 Tax=Leptobrachium leishanense TaxID=445787 RepID=A0A8C5R106_9ANUR
MPGIGSTCQTALQMSVRNESDKHPLPPIAKTSQNGEKGSVNFTNVPLSERQALQNILTQWMEIWMLRVRWQDATLEQLKRDLTSVHSARKISGLAIIASASVNRPRDGTDYETMDTISDVPAEMLPFISNALKDEDILVRIAAAFCQFFLREINEDARKVLFAVVEDGTSTDSWIAAQCLALQGDNSYLVIRRILTQLFEDRTEDTTMQACYLLRELSKRTNVIHSMLGDELNSGNWTDRILVCRTIGQLLGGVSQDLINKLIYLMWRDWNIPVRWTAAEALQQMGYRNLVHDQMRRHIEGGDWRAKMDALSLIGGLQHMTDQLLPGFIKCFSDDYMNVRRRACQTAGLLQTKDETVLNCLCDLIQNDPAWKNQVFAIKALGKIGQVTDRVKELLLRAIRSEVSGVRLEACRCIATLRQCDSDVKNVLQDQMVLESHDLVKRELSRTLTALNVEPDGIREITSLIQQQISKLCQKEELIPKVLNVSETLEMEHQKMEMGKKNPLWKYKLHDSKVSGGPYGHGRKESSSPLCKNTTASNRTKSEKVQAWTRSPKNLFSTSIQNYRLSQDTSCILISDVVERVIQRGR